MTPLPLKFALKVTHPLWTPKFWQLSAHSASTVRAGEKVQLIYLPYIKKQQNLGCLSNCLCADCAQNLPRWKPFFGPIEYFHDRRFVSKSKRALSGHACCSYVELPRSKLHKTGDHQVGNCRVNCQLFILHLRQACAEIATESNFVFTLCDAQKASCY